MYTMTNNADFNSLEISFPGKPSAAVRDALKGLRFRWHGVKKLWYGYADAAAVRDALAAVGCMAEDAPAKEAKEAAQEAPVALSAELEKINDFGVKVGDLFCASWGWEQTNVDFFQVVALVGKSSVRVRQVAPVLMEEEVVSSMSGDYTYQVPSELLPPCRSFCIKDQEKGDLKRLRLGYDADPAKARENCSIKIDSVITAFKVNGNSIKCYESWYA